MTDTKTEENPTWIGSPFPGYKTVPMVFDWPGITPEDLQKLKDSATAVQQHLFVD
jgi:hypothetical protein